MLCQRYLPICAGIGSSKDAVADTSALVAALEHYSINTLPTFPVNMTKILRYNLRRNIFVVLASIALNGQGNIPMKMV